MKRFATMLAVAMLLVAPAAMAQDGLYDGQYGWTISNSTISAFSNFGAYDPVSPPPFPNTAYLWLDCTGVDGAGGADFGIIVPAGDFLFAVNMAPGFSNFGAGSDLSLVLGTCEVGPVLVADIVVVSGTPGDMCIGPNNTSGIFATIDCGSANFGKHQFNSVGFSAGGVAPPGACSASQPLCQTVSVESESWGTIKGLYR